MFGWKNKTGQSASARVPLDRFSEGALLTIYAYLWPQQSAAGEYFAPVYGTVAAALRAELQRRWTNRGGPIALELPERLPALSIEIGCHIFKTLGSLLETSGEGDAALKTAGEKLEATGRQMADARDLCIAIATAIADVRVELGATFFADAKEGVKA